MSWLDHDGPTADELVALEAELMPELLADVADQAADPDRWADQLDDTALDCWAPMPRRRRHERPFLTTDPDALRRALRRAERRHLADLHHSLNLTSPPVPALPFSRSHAS